MQTEDAGAPASEPVADAQPPASSTAVEDLVAIVRDHGGVIDRVPAGEVQDLVDAGEARLATDRDLAIAGQA